MYRALTAKVLKKVVVARPAQNVSFFPISRRYSMLFGGPDISNVERASRNLDMASFREPPVTTTLARRGSKDGVIDIPVST
jgi:hypothetical protein